VLQVVALVGAVDVGEGMDLESVVDVVGTTGNRRNGGVVRVAGIV
jgi:hypothetical protein